MSTFTGDSIATKFLWFYAFILSFIQCSIAEESNCATDMPQLGPTDKLEVLFFYETNYANNVEADLCCVIEEFGGLISLKYRMGALAKQEENDELSCGPAPCDDDRYLACEYMLDPSFNDCGPVEIPNEEDLENCLCNFESDEILIANGNAREEYGIPEDQLPALVFNEKYDECANISSAEEIKKYVCKLYDNQAEPCKNNGT